ncbi:MAG: DMT family transporter [SAR324 cluster bacterium]|nr:DMT family transporter [SAR324 cluster bacterium]
MAPVGKSQAGEGAGRAQDLVALHGAVLLFGTAGLFGKWIAAGPMLIVFGRVVFAALTLGLLLAARRKGLKLPARRGWWLLGACGVLLVLHWAAFFHSIQVSTVAVGLLAYATAPVFAVLLEPFWFREPFSLRSLLASMLSLAGVALLIARWELGDSTLQGASWGVVAGSSFAVLSLINRELRREHDAAELAFIQDGLAAMLLLPLLPLFWEQPAPRDLALLAVLGVVFTALAHGLYIQALRGVRVRMATLVSTMEHVYGVALAALLLGEIPSPRTIAGGVLILAAVTWVTLKPGTEAETGKSGP